MVDNLSSAKEAIETYRKKIHGIIDQDLDGFVIVMKMINQLGTINDEDSVNIL